MARATRWRCGIRVIYQELNLVPQLSVAENIFLGAAPTRWPGVIDWRALYDDTRRAARRSRHGSSTPATRVDRLSLAQRQMVEIAKALRDSELRRGAVLVMDEPTSALTSREVDQLFALIERLTARGVAIVYITHRLDEVYRIGQRVTVLRDGRHVATQLLPETTRRRARAPDGQSRGRRALSARCGGRAGAELLRVEHVATRAACSATSACRLHAGEVLGIGGLLGAGRSELARVLAGADRADAGRIVIDGSRVTFRTPARRDPPRHRLLPEDRKARGSRRGPRPSRATSRCRTAGGSRGSGSCRARGSRISPRRSSTISASRPRRRSRCGC